MLLAEANRTADLQTVTLLVTLRPTRCHASLSSPSDSAGTSPRVLLAAPKSSANLQLATEALSTFLNAAPLFYSCFEYMMDRSVCSLYSQNAQVALLGGGQNRAERGVARCRIVIGEFQGVHHHLKIHASVGLKSSEAYSDLAPSCLPCEGQRQGSSPSCFRFNPRTGTAPSTSNSTTAETLPSIAPTTTSHHQRTQRAGRTAEFAEGSAGDAEAAVG